ncbi:hypothetical protein N7490_005663 [Penicillium lividum]|nr:hypothetical protein N7490_005663 [Penicillium lividum]
MHKLCEQAMLALLSIKSQKYTSEDKASEISERPSENNEELDWQKPTPARGPVPNPPTPRRQVQEGIVDSAILPSIVQTVNQKSVGKSSETQPENLERDSGYASASRAATLTVSSEIPFRPNIEPPIPGTLNETRLGYDDKLQSLASDNEDINSRVSGDSNNEEKMASQALIRVFLAEEPHFRELCEKAMLQMSRERFMENMRRLLKSFHKNLSTEAETEAEKAVARIMRSRRGRQRISQQLAVHILEEQGEGLKSDQVDLQVAPKDKNRVETWLAQTFEIPPGSRGVEAQGTNIAYSTSGSDDSSEAGEFPYISEMKTFMRKARSFQVLLKDLMIMFFPSDLRGVLLSIPKKNIWVSQEQDLSLLNRVKGWIEDQTQARWNWWPLKPSKRLLKDSESRMFWKCVSRSSYL